MAGGLWSAHYLAHALNAIIPRLTASIMNLSGSTSSLFWDMISGALVQVAITVVLIAVPLIGARGVAQDGHTTNRTTGNSYGPFGAFAYQIVIGYGMSALGYALWIWAMRVAFALI